ncbi:MAG: HEAT repeat domain-containing protein [Polyangiales bacterium]
MSSDKRYLRQNPEKVVRREPSEPPRESFIRAKSNHGVESALDFFQKTEDPAALTDFDEDVITDALIRRLGTHDVRTLVPFRDRMTGVVLVGFGSDSLEMRRAATEFAKLSPRAEFVRPLLALALDAAEPLRSQARETVAGYEGLLHNGCVWLRGLLVSSQTSQQRRRRSMELLAMFGDPRALAPFIDLLGDADRSIARAAHEALRTLTCHDLGNMRSAWQRWAEKSQTRSRIDWLIEALADRRPELREDALAALSRITGQSFGVKPGEPRPRFLVAQEQFAALRLNSPSSLRGLTVPPPDPAGFDKKYG